MNENILLIRLKSIGDVMFTLPAVNAVRANFPAAKISFLTSRENAPLLRGFRAVNEIIALDRPALKSGHPLKITGELFPLLRRLRAARFALAADFQGFGETEWLAWWSGAPEIWGNQYNSFRGWLYTRSAARDTTVHPAAQNLSLLRQGGLKIGLGGNDYVLPAEASAGAREFFTTQKLDARQPTLYLQPFTSNPAKNWPLAQFLALARQGRSRGMQIIFGGGPSERTALEPARAAGFVVAAGASLPVSAGLMQSSSLVVGADTGLLHLAVALGQRVVMIMNSNHPGSCHPFQHPEWTVTPSAGKTVAEIETGRVMDAVEQALAGR